MCSLVHHVSAELSGPRGKTVDYLLRPDRGIAAAQAFLRKALATSLPRWPRKITLDGHAPSHQALRLLRRENPRWKDVLVRSCPYLNNIVEQDHHAIKRRSTSMLGFKSFGNAAITLAGIELAHRIRKPQFSLGPGLQWRNQSLKQRGSSTSLRTAPAPRDCAAHPTGAGGSCERCPPGPLQTPAVRPTRHDQGIAR